MSIHKQTQKFSAVYPEHWTPDSRHILGRILSNHFGGGWKCGIFDVPGNRIRQILPADQSFYLSSDTRMVAPNRLLQILPKDFSTTLGVVSFNNLVENQPFEIVEYGLDTTLHLTQKRSVAPPRAKTIEETKISPTGDRIAWLVDAAHVDPVLARLRRLLPFLQTSVQPHQELWVSRLDGTGMRVVGQVPILGRNRKPPQVSDLRWLPDGKHLSFAYDDALWTVPAPRE